MNVNDITETLEQLNELHPEFVGMLHLRTFADGSTGVPLSGFNLVGEVHERLYDFDSETIEECILSIKKYLKENN